jgi:heme A synthase
LIIVGFFFAFTGATDAWRRGKDRPFAAATLGLLVAEAIVGAWLLMFSGVS